MLIVLLVCLFGGMLNSMSMAVAETVCGQKEKNRLPALVQRQFGWSHANQ